MESEFYLQARREWDERYGDLVLGKRNWQITSAGLMLLSLILALGIVWMSARTKVIPFVVEVDKLGYAITIPTALTASNVPATIERMKRYEIAAFIRDARFVSSEPALEQNMLNDLLAHAHGAANKFLESYFHADDFAKWISPQFPPNLPEICQKSSTGSFTEIQRTSGSGYSRDEWVKVADGGHSHPAFLQPRLCPNLHTNRVPEAG